MTQKGAEGAVDAILGHKARHIPIFAAGQFQELPVRAVWILVDAALGQGTEVRVAPLQAASKRMLRFDEADGAPKDDREPGKESDAHPEVVEATTCSQKLLGLRPPDAEGVPKRARVYRGSVW